MSKNNKSTSEPKSNKEVVLLKAQVAELQLTNKELKAKTNQKAPKRHVLKNILTSFLIIIGIISFTFANVAGWARYTIIDNEGFLQATQPLIDQPAVQEALQQDISNAIFDNINLEERLRQSLPPDIAFLAAPLASQVESFGTAKIGEVIRSQQVSEIWGKTLSAVHQELIDYILNEQNDGVISINEVYGFISNELTNTQIGFLLNRQLPPKIGNITIADIDGVQEAREALNILQKLPVILFLVSIVSFLLALVLAQNKKTTLVVSVVLLNIMMLFTLLGIFAGQSVAVANVDKSYSDATREVYSVVTNSLVQRTQGYIALFSVTLILLFVTSKLKYVVVAKKYLKKAVNSLIVRFIPAFSYPDWLANITHNRNVTAWIIFTLIFVIFGFRLPPETTQVISSFIGATIVALIYIIVTKILMVAKNKQSSSVK